jgi:hypothetical protein
MVIEFDDVNGQRPLGFGKVPILHPQANLFVRNPFGRPAQRGCRPEQKANGSGLDSTAKPGSLIG